MPLLDHFRPPLSERRHWQGFFVTWVNTLAAQLNRGILPDIYFAETLIQQGVASSSEPVPVQKAIFTIPTAFPPTFEVHVFNSESGPRLTAVIALVSPTVKDRLETRRAFVAKCASYLSQGISVIVVDVVTTRQHNFHNALMEFFGQDSKAALTDEINLYAVAYRPLRRQDQDEIEIWPQPLKIGDALPSLPLFPAVDLAIPVDLEAAYTEACADLRVS